MKTYLKTIFLSAAALLLATAAHAYDFSVENEDGMTLFYNVISLTDKTCELAYCKDAQKIYVGKVRIPEAVSYNSIDFTVIGIGISAFADCTQLTSIDIPSNITYLGARAFRGCEGLTSFQIPTSITKLENNTFEGCTGLTSITIPENITDFGERVFYCCI